VSELLEFKSQHGGPLLVEVQDHRVSQLRATTTWPDYIEVEFSAKPSADSNVIIARTVGEANFHIAPKWSTDRRG
jgi:hypothetical protein